jgi:hypothetical protein
VNETILLNGRGDARRFGFDTQLSVPDTYTLEFEEQTEPRPKRYLLRLINTSFDTTFVFSIDNHRLIVVGADFVPIHNYTTTSVLIGIGQRYHVIVEAKPVPDDGQKIPEDRNFWIRTHIANCRDEAYRDGYELSGILRYNKSSKANPTTKQWNCISLACSDEPYESLKPIVPWVVGSPANGNGGEEQNVRFKKGSKKSPYPLARFALQPPNADLNAFNPLRINYSNPTFLNLDNKQGWIQELAITAENYTDSDWVSISLVHMALSACLHQT